MQICVDQVWTVHSAYWAMEAEMNIEAKADHIYNMYVDLFLFFVKLGPRQF